MIRHHHMPINFCMMIKVVSLVDIFLRIFLYGFCIFRGVGDVAPYRFSGVGDVAPYEAGSVACFPYKS